jgi:hypothetical protein
MKFVYYMILIIFILLIGCNKDYDTPFPALKIANQAIEKNDVGLCTKQFNKFQSPKDLKICISYYIEKTGDILACNKFSSKDKNKKEMNNYEIDNCKKTAAIYNNNSKQCKGITTPEIHDDCFIHFADVPFGLNSNHNYCLEILNDSKKDECLFWSSRSNPNYNACLAITNITLQYRCYYDYAYNTENISLCDTIDNIEIRENCILSLIDEQSNCEKIINKKNDCYINLLEKTRDSKYCSFIDYKNISNRSKQLFNLFCLEFKNPIDVCLEKQIGHKSMCLKEIAIETGNYTLCGLSDDHQVYIDTCYFGVSEGLFNLEICDFIEDKYKKDSCLDKFKD